jgi:hypothetical protein
MGMRWNILTSGSRSRAKRFGIQDHFTVEELMKLLAVTGRKCAACGKGEDECRLSIDHIVPLSRGGTNTIENIQILCLPCNQAKADMAISYVRNEDGVIARHVSAAKPPSPKGRERSVESSIGMQVGLTHDEMLKIVALAKANTGKNKSMMVRELINLAYLNPSGLGLHPPEWQEVKGGSNEHS